jgi:hypothetical protein
LGHQGLNTDATRFRQVKTRKIQSGHCDFSKPATDAGNRPVPTLLLALSRDVLVTVGFLWLLGRFRHARLPAVFSALILLTF